MSHIPDVAVRRAAVVLFIVALIPSLVVAERAVSLVENGGYSALYQAESGIGVSAAPAVLSGFLMPSGFLLLAGSGRNRWSRVFACVLIGSYILLQMFLGFRGVAVVVLAAFLWLWHRAIRRLPTLVPVLVLAAVAVLVLPLVGITRNSAGSDRISLTAWENAYASIDNPAVAILSEMGGSMIAPAYTIRFVPTDHAYELGSSYAYGVLSLIPNLFWPVHPAAEHSPSKWLVEKAEPATARAGGGLGYSVIAEAYLNFGFLGAGVPMVLLGWGIGRLSRWTDVNYKVWKLGLVAIVLVPLLMYARAEAGNVLRGVVWYAGIPYFMVRLWPKRPLHWH
jgi:oligosaccharide repeat unit polymerase